MRTDGQTDLTNLIVAFFNFANVFKNRPVSGKRKPFQRGERNQVNKHIVNVRYIKRNTLSYKACCDVR